LSSDYAPQAGLRYVYFRTDSSANTVTINATGGQTIDGRTSITLPRQFSAVEITRDGANWVILNTNYTALNRKPVRAVTTTPVTLTLDDGLVTVDATIGDITVNLPTASSAKGLTYEITKIDSSDNSVIVDANGGELISGETTQEFDVQYTTLSIYSDGSAWYIK